MKRRGQAVGLSLAGTAFGMMLMPQAVKFLLEAYDFRGTILILGAFALNAIVGSTLLQPAKWHFVPEFKDEEEAYHQVGKLLEMPLCVFVVFRIANNECVYCCREYPSFSILMR